MKRTAAVAHLRFDSAALRSGFGAAPVRLRHDLAGAPGLSFADLVGLARRLDPVSMEATSAHVPVATPGGVPPSAFPPEAVAARLPDVDGRLGLLALQPMPFFRSVLDAVLGQVVATVGAPEGRIVRDETSVFLAPPGTVVPVHFDSHHNVLLQLESTKTISLGAFAGDEQARALEYGCTVGKRLVAVEPPATAHLELGPGDGLYIPPYTLHWVTVGPEPSAALSCSFSTPVTERGRHVHACNARLRRFGIRPRPPGRSVLRDRVKATAITTARRVRR